jgi:hypothetical protein
LIRMKRCFCYNYTQIRLGPLLSIFNHLQVVWEVLTHPFRAVRAQGFATEVTISINYCLFIILATANNKLIFQDIYSGAFSLSIEVVPS